MVLAANVRMHRLARACGFGLAEAVDGTVEMTHPPHPGQGR
jgi:hypothetical protein